MIPKLRFPQFKSDWKIKRLDSISNLSAGGTPSTRNLDYWGGHIKWMSSGDLNKRIIDDVDGRITQLGLENSSAKLIPENSVLIGLAGQGKTRGTVAINKVELTSNQSVAHFKNITEDYQFVYFSLFKDYERLRRLSTGDGGRGGLNLSILGAYKVSFPEITEQLKISKLLVKVDQKINLLTKKKEALETYKKGLMQKIFSQELRFKRENGTDYPEWERKELIDIMDYEQPTKYIVDSTEYSDHFKTPVLTAGKTFILGFTDEDKNHFTDFPVIIFDDFTTAFKFVDFAFKVKSSAMKILRPRENVNVRFVYEAMKIIRFPKGEHKRYWISEYCFMKIPFPSEKEQHRIAALSVKFDQKTDAVDRELETIQKLKKGLLQQMFV